MSSKDYVLAIQAALNHIDSARLKLDGVLGPETRSRLEESSAEAGVPIQAFAQVETARVRATNTEQPGSSGRSSWWSIEDLALFINEAEELFDYPAAEMEMLIDIEAASQVGEDGVRRYDAYSRRGSFRGLTQMGQAAWTDAQEWASSRGTHLPGYDSVFEPRWSILAAASYSQRYVESNSSLIGRFPPFSLRYALHNQGPGFIARARAGTSMINFRGQSERAQMLLSSATEFIA